MIAHISGTLGERWERSCIVLTSGGVGYELALPDHAFMALPEKGGNVAFFTSLAVREDALELYGFGTFAERQTFELLTGISRVGARTALAIISTYRPGDLRRIIIEGNVAALTKVSGIGQKSAQHIFLELKYKLGSLAAEENVERAAPPSSPVFTDALAALINLGYAEEECGKLVHEIISTEPDIDAGGAIKRALRKMAGSKN